MAAYCYPWQPEFEEEQERHIFEYIPAPPTNYPQYPAAACFPPVPIASAGVCYPAMPPPVIPQTYTHPSACNCDDAYKSQQVPYVAPYYCAPAAPPVIPAIGIMPQAPYYAGLPAPAPQGYPSSFPIGPQPGLNYHDAYQEPHAWHGRTKAQVELDNQAMALKEGVWQNNEATPHDPKPDQQFWCIELDGTRTLRTADTIEFALRPGQWRKDPTYGNMYFVRYQKAPEKA